MGSMELKANGIPARGEEIGGKYRVEKVIGQGGMGAVFAARNVLTNKRVAIKWLWPEHAGSVNRDRLLREAQLAGSIEHPNIVDIYDVGEHHGGLFLVMEYLPGRPLSELMTDRGRLDPHELIPLLVPAMRGVHAAHLAGVIHRDLKPENIILSEHETVIIPKVVDFGVSKVTALSAIPDASLTRAGALVGTPHYMALEQINGSSIIDPRTDVYAFGVLLYRGLTGRYPFDGATISEIILRIGTTEAPSMRIARPELPAGLDEIVLRALARDFELRFSSLEELIAAVTPFAGDLDAVGGGSWQGAIPANTIGPQPVRAASASSERVKGEDTFRTESAARVTRRRRILVGALALALLVGAGLSLGGIRDAAMNELARLQPIAEDASKNDAPAPRETDAPPAREEVAATNTSLDAPLPEDLQDVAEEPAAPVERATRQNEVETRQAARRASHAAGRPRESAQPVTAKGTRAVIPGKRTNGLSVDDF